MNNLYDKTCSCCVLPDLADDEKDWDAIYSEIARQLISGEALTTDAIYNHTVKQLADAMNKGFGATYDDADSRKALQASFIKNIERFSYAKTLTQFSLFKDAVFNDKGQVQSFESVKKAVANTGEVFNNNYLRAEHQFVSQSAIMANKWGNLDTEYLEFNTVGDGGVRPEHKIFDKFTAKKSDPIWKRLYTPLAWGCRCTVIPGISKNLSAEYDGEWANKLVDPLVKGTIFDNNAALTGNIFNDKHPYFRTDGKKLKGIKSDKSENNINLKDFIKGDIPTDKEIKNILLRYAEVSPGDFRKGLDAVKISSSQSYMMQHSMKYNPRTGQWVDGSTISISKNTFRSIEFNPLEEFRTGLGAIKKGTQMTFKQEYSFESMWHEILHAKTQSQPTRLSQMGVKNMEIINQFCARHTYPKFIEKFGGKAAHQDEILQNGYGYKQWVGDFREKLKVANIDEKLAVKELMPKLLTDYGTIGSKTREFIDANTK